MATIVVSVDRALSSLKTFVTDAMFLCGFSAAFELVNSTITMKSIIHHAEHIGLQIQHLYNSADNVSQIVNLKAVSRHNVAIVPAISRLSCFSLRICSFTRQKHSKFNQTGLVPRLKQASHY